MQAKLKPLIGDGETLWNSALAQTMPKPMLTKQFSTATAASFKSSVGFVFGAGFATQLTVPTPDGEVRLVFPSAFRGNKDQAMAITQSLTRN